MPRFEGENQVQRQEQNNRHMHQNVQANQNAQANQNVQANQNAQINISGAANGFENGDLMARPSAELLGIINGEGQVDNEAIRQRLEVAERLSQAQERQLNVHRAAAHLDNENQAGI